MTDIESERLRLTVITEEIAQALCDGDREAAERALGARIPGFYPDLAERSSWLPRQIDRLRSMPDRAEWMGRFIVLRADSEAIGHAGFHGPPERNGRAEIGYTVFEDHRGRGYATEACAALTEWAFAQGEPAVFLSIRPDNAPSLAIARRLGYVEVGSQMDPEDGLELVFQRRMPAAVDG